MSITIGTAARQRADLAGGGETLLRVDHNAEDDLIASLIGAARGRRSGHWSRPNRTSGARELDIWRRDAAQGACLGSVRSPTSSPCGCWPMARGVIDPERYRLEGNRDRPRLVFPSGFPSTLRSAGGIEIEYDCGYADEASDLPVALRVATMQIVACSTNCVRAKAPYRDGAGADAPVQCAGAAMSESSALFARQVKLQRPRASPMRSAAPPSYGPMKASLGAGRCRRRAKPSPSMHALGRAYRVTINRRDDVRAGWRIAWGAALRTPALPTRARRAFSLCVRRRGCEAETDAFPPRASVRRRLGTATCRRLSPIASTDEPPPDLTFPYVTIGRF